ncbi:unnamed protein product [Rhizophagus irregularis]|nr:unnamed protein product [Rhizophagus irregularis]
MTQLIGDVLLLTFNELHDDLTSLHSVLIENPFNYKQESREKFYNVVTHFLPNNSEYPLPQNNIELPLNKFPKGPTFKYNSQHYGLQIWHNYQ